MLMVIGLVMMITGSLFWMGWSISRGRTEDLLVFFGGAILSIVTLLFLFMTDDNIFTYNIPLIIGIRIIVFVLGLMMTFSVLFRYFSVMDKIQVILDKFGLYRTTRMNKTVSLIFLVIVGIVTIIVIKLM